MSRKTRQTVTMLVLCVLLVVAGIGYYALIKYQSSQQEKEETAEEESIPLYEMDDSKIQKLHYKNEKAEMNLVKQKNVWKVEDDLDFPLDQNKITTMVDAVTAVSADQLVTEKCDNLDEYQLNNPDLTVEVEDSSGNKQTLVIGMESVSGGGRYAYCGDSSKIYLLSTSIYSSFDYTSGQIMETADFPTITADYVTGLKIDAKKGKDFEVVYDKKNSPYKHIYSWAINSPYSQPVAADVDQLQTLFESYSDLDFSEGVLYKSDSSALKKYGLDQPAYEITLDYYKKSGSKKKIPKTLQLLIGKQNKDKTGYYAQINKDDGIYLLDVSTVESLVKITPLNYVYQRLYAGNIDDLNAMDIKYQGKNYQISVKKAKTESDNSDEDNEDSEEEVTYTVKVDGKEADSQNFQSAFEAISYLAPNGEIDSKVKIKSDKPAAQIIFHEKKKDVSMNIYPYDGNNFYRIEVDGVMQFVVDIRTVDSILEDFTTLTE